MDFQRFQLHATTNDKPFKAHRNKRRCDNAFYSCNIFPNNTNTDMMSQIVYELFYFNQKILSLTQELWSDLLSIVGQVNILSRKKGCFSINNADECMALNAFYLKFNADLVHYQSLYLDSECVKDDHDQLKNVFDSLEFFLNKTLPIIEKNFNNLTVMISICKDGGCSERSFYKENVGNNVNNAVKKYLFKFRQTVACLGQEKIPPEMTIRKEKIISEIDRIYTKKGGLLENIESDCSIKPYLVDNINDNNVTKETAQPFNNDMSSDNLVYKDTFVLNAAVDTTQEHIKVSKFKIKAERTHKLPDITLSTFNDKQLNINEYITHDIHKKNDAYKYDALPSLMPEQLDEIEYASNEYVIFFFLTVSVFGLIAFFVYFAIKKYKRRKKNQLKKGQIICFDEHTRFRDYFLNN